MLACFVSMAAVMPLMLAAPQPPVVLGAVGVLAGPAAVIIMALPARVLPRGSRHLGMGVFFSLYYLGMALAPGIAGWLRDQTRNDVAPLLFASALVLTAAVLAVVFQRLERRGTRNPMV